MHTSPPGRQWWSLRNLPVCQLWSSCKFVFVMWHKEESNQASISLTMKINSLRRWGQTSAEKSKTDGGKIIQWAVRHRLHHARSNHVVARIVVSFDSKILNFYPTVRVSSCDWILDNTSVLSSQHGCVKLRWGQARDGHDCPLEHDENLGACSPDPVGSRFRVMGSVHDLFIRV